jgi:uncharacterized protein (TIGR04255 family)
MARKITSVAQLPSFRKPPINEVVCGLRFQPIEALLIPHVGLYWGSIRKDFPRCEHAAPLGIGEGVTDSATGLPLPRVWLINAAQDRLIQIQRDVFFYNWRRREEKAAYPRYNSIISCFKKTLQSFEIFLEENEIGKININECELTYINQLPSGELWKSSSDFGRLFPDIKWRSRTERFLPIPNHIAWRASFSLPEGKGSLGVKIDHALRKVDQKPLIIFELRATGTGDDKSLDSVWDWFATAHEWIVRGFADLTGTKAQEIVWERDDSFTGSG